MLKSLSFKVQFVFFLLLCVVFLGFEYDRLGDLHIYLSASSDLFKEGNIYKNLYGKKFFFYLGNPFLSVLVYPLTFLSFTLVAELFKLLNILLLFRIWRLILNYFSSTSISPKKLALFQSIVFVCCFFLIYSNLHMVQFTILLLYLSLEGLYQIIEKKRNLLGAFLVSLAIGIKLSPIVLIPYLIYRNQIKAALWSILLCTAYFFLPVLVLGWTENMQLWGDWWTRIEPVSKEQIFDTNNRKNHGISTLISTLFLKDLTDNVVHLSNRRYLIGLGEGAVQVLIYSARIFLASFTLYFMRSMPFKKQPEKLSRLWEVSYLLMVIPLFFPQQRIYNFIFLLPAISYIVFRFLFEKKSIPKVKVKQLVFSLAIILLNLELLLGQYRKFYWHYKTITYATIVLLILLCFLPPKSKAEEI